MTEASPTTPRRWFRFSLSALLIVLAVVAALSAWIAKERQQSAYEQHLAEELEAKGYNVSLDGPYASWETYVDQKPQGWWRDLARSVLGQRIISVQLFLVEGGDLSPLVGLSNLQSLDVMQVDVSDITPLAGLTTLQYLELVATKVTDITPLANLHNLKELDLMRTPVSDLTALTGLLNLESLNVEGTESTKEQVEAVQKALPNCQIKHRPFR